MTSMQKRNRSIFHSFSGTEKVVKCNFPLEPWNVALILKVFQNDKKLNTRKYIKKKFYFGKDLSPFAPKHENIVVFLNIITTYIFTDTTLDFSCTL